MTSQPRHRPPAVLGAATLAAAALVLAGCGSGNAGQPTGIDAGVQQQLRHDLATLAAAASGGHRDAARTALAALNADADAAHVAGELDDAHLTAIRDAAARVEADLTSTPPRPTPTVTVTAPPAAPSGPGKGHGDKHGKGHGDGGDGGD